MWDEGRRRRNSNNSGRFRGKGRERVEGGLREDGELEEGGRRLSGWWGGGIVSVGGTSGSLALLKFT